MTKKYKGIKRILLSEYLTPQMFRTITKDLLKIPGGITEIPVMVEMNPKFFEKLNFKVPTTGILYGFIKKNHNLIEIEKQKGKIKKIELHDWGTEFLLVIEVLTGEEIAYNVSNKEVQELLENCLRTPEQS
ncbi:hypothetical protein [Defluviitalea phaphyphila]|uniref:hypothetical protein n=1 Tax=Defluviitalea phaphyphila TaxID=1473580 RepID=UPI00073083D1|nr:hypothetical protein [Defluviitalea phaphyphila]